MKIKTLMLVIGLLTIYAQPVRACVIALTNDSDKPLLIVTDDFKEGMLLLAGGFVEFGNKKYMANFRVMHQKGKHFTEQYHVQQTACTPNKYTKLTISEIENSKDIPFKISPAQAKQIVTKSGCGCEH
jgi:hypothetical protein